MSTAPSALCELLPWDTEFFDCRIARVLGDRLDEARALQIEKWIEVNRIQCLYFLARADDPLTIALAEKHAYEWVDVRVTLENENGLGSVESGGPDQEVWMTGALDRNLGGNRWGTCPATITSEIAISTAKPLQVLVDESNGEPSAFFRIRPALPGDVPRLEDLARANHHNTRFFRDSHFPRARAEDLYATWIGLECRGRAQQVLAATATDDRLLGYISCHLEPARRVGQIGLMGVDRTACGRGVGKGLVSAALNWFRSEGVQKVIVVTQGANLPALRLYEKCGFINCNVQRWYHKWPPERNQPTAPQLFHPV